MTRTTTQLPLDYGKAAPAAPETAAGKEAWRMRYGEYERWYEQQWLREWGRPLPQTEHGTPGTQHAFLVREALEEGKPVPLAVIRDHAGQSWADDALDRLAEEAYPSWVWERRCAEVERHLRRVGYPFVEVSENVRALFAGQGSMRIDPFDYIIYLPDGFNVLLTVEPFASEGVTEKMEKWEAVFGDGFAAYELCSVEEAALVLATAAGVELRI